MLILIIDCEFDQRSDFFKNAACYFFNRNVTYWPI